MKFLNLILKNLPLSIQMQEQKPEPIPQRNKAKFVPVLIKGNIEICNVRCLPSDLPTVKDWYRIRVFQDEFNGISLTN